MGWDFPWFNKSCIQLSRRSVDPIIYRFGVFIDPSTCLAGFWHIITQKHFPQATSRKTQKKVAFSKKLHLTRETGSNAAEIFFCYVFQTINSQLADRLLFLVLWGGGGKLIKKTIAPSYLRKASQYFTDTMITTYEATQQGSCFSWFRWRYLRLLHKT